MHRVDGTECRIMIMSGLYHRIRNIIQQQLILNLKCAMSRTLSRMEGRVLPLGVEYSGYDWARLKSEKNPRAPKLPTAAEHIVKLIRAKRVSNCYIQEKKICPSVWMFD